MLVQQESDRVLTIRFFACCAIVLGGLSSAWSLYLCLRYPVDPKAALSHLGPRAAILVGGLVALLLLPKQRTQSFAHRRHRFSTVQFDKLVRYCLLFATIINVITLPTVIGSYHNTVSANASFMPVKVRVNTIQVRYVPAETVEDEVLLKRVFYSPELYLDLWVASGDVTIVERDGKSIEPVKSQALFTVPNVYSTGTRSSYRAYIQHHKMDAMMDSERYRVGELYSGWVLRDGTGPVFFERPSDKLFFQLCIIASLVLIPCLYFLMRVAFGSLSASYMFGYNGPNQHPRHE
jgi:hypothetical protein